MCSGHKAHGVRPLARRNRDLRPSQRPRRDLRPRSLHRPRRGDLRPRSGKSLRGNSLRTRFLNALPTSVPAVSATIRSRPLYDDRVPFEPGDRVHFAGLGTGVVREVRSGGRYAVEIKGRVVVAAAGQLELASGARVSAAKPASVEANSEPVSSHAAASRSIDLHGKTVAEAVDALEIFINDALLDGSSEIRVIHGRSGGRLRTAVHRYLRQLPSIGTTRVDPHNPGVTIVTFA